MKSFTLSTPQCIKLDKFTRRLFLKTYDNYIFLVFYLIRSSVEECRYLNNFKEWTITVKVVMVGPEKVKEKKSHTVNLSLFKFSQFVSSHTINIIYFTSFYVSLFRRIRYRSLLIDDLLYIWWDVTC